MAYAPVHDYFDINSTFSFPVEHGQYPLDQREHVVSPESRSFSPTSNRKQHADMELQEVSPYWATPGHPMPTAPSHQRGWSGSTISTAKEPPMTKEEPAALLSPHNPRRSFRKKASACLPPNGPWYPEVITILISWATVGAIMGVLARYNGAALPEWPYYITLNALIALLATIATACMSISLQSGLSQLKWIRFKESKAPLSDMEAFDEASRGTWGALKLLATARGGILGSLGAVVAVVALALGPFAQQVVTYESRSVESQQGASINRALNYTGALPGKTSSTGFVPILPLKSAVYSGLFAENGRPAASLAFSCATGNCTWAPYETLGVCHSCVDLSPFIQMYCGNDTLTSSGAGCGWQVPQGGRLDTSLDVFGMTSHVPAARGDTAHSTIVRLVFMGTEAHDGLAGEKKPWARQCVLSACVQTLASAVTNGVLEERVVDEYVNTTVLDISDSGDDDGTDVNVYVASPRSNSSTPYVLSIEAMLAMRGWFATVFATGSAIRNAAGFNRTVTANDSGSSSSAVVVNLTVGIASGETFFDSDVVTAFYWNYYEYADGLDMLMRDTATSMTVAFRSFQGVEAVRGHATSVESYVCVHWGFAVLPILTVTGAALFIAAAIYKTKQSRTEPWKSSALATLLHGLDEDTRAQFEHSRSLKEEKYRAKGIKVKLSEADDNRTLLRV
ncbi:hypothetical protein GGR53DRAFT_193355 [Hypoxylon sp. FL1150]|nr:hypothetical protein GGR53DRAFT_193355 [Hypoxylon sp. FL1150]